MPTVRIPIDLAWTGSSGSPGVNVWHVRTNALDVVNEDVNYLAGVLETFYDECSDIFPSDFTARFLGEAYGVGDDEGTVYVGDPWTIAGSGGTPHLPPATAMFVNWRGSTGGRRGRGRTYLSPLVTADNEGNGTPVEQVRTWVQTAADNLIESSDSFANGAVGVYSRVSNTFRDFVSAEVPNKFASLRSRRD